MDYESYDLSGARRSFCRIALALTALFVLDTLAGWALEWLVYRSPRLELCFRSYPLAEWLFGMIPLYGVAVPAAVLLLKRIPAKTPGDIPLKKKYFLEFIPITIFVMYTGSIVGVALSYAFTGGTAINPVAEYLKDTTILKVIQIVVLAPLVEEFVFRKLIIDHSLPYGEKWAVLLSGISFGLLHQNFYQFFYATGLGLLLAYIYVRTGRLRYTILLHGIINFMGGIIAPWLSQVAEFDAQSLGAFEVLMFGLAFLYSISLISLYIFGMVRTIARCKQLLWIPEKQDLPKGKGWKIVFCNPFMILYTILCMGVMVLMLFQG